MAVGVLLMGMAVPAWSLGFGRPVSHAILGEAFNATVPVRLESAETLAIDCLAADVFFGDEKLPSAAISVTLMSGQGNERTMRVTTTALINEPVVTLYVVAGCNAKVTRKFVAFADPPMAMPATMAAPMANGSSVVPPPSGKAASAESPNGAVVMGLPVAQAAAQSVAESPKAGSRHRGGRKLVAAADSRSNSAPSSSAVRPDAVPAQQAKTQVERAASTTGLTSTNARSARRKGADTLSAKIDAGAAKRSSSGASRLVLDPVEADAVVAPNLSMSGQMVSVPADLDSPEARDRRAAAAALWAAMNASPEQVARDRQRVQELEQRLAKLQQDAASARDKVMSMEARVREAENARLSSPIVVGLAGACLLLAGGLGWMFWRQRQRDADGNWWQPEPLPADGTDVADDSALSLAEPALDRTAAEFVAVLPKTGGSISVAQPDAAPIELVAPALKVIAPASIVAPGLAASVVTSVSAATKLPILAGDRVSVIKSEAQDAAREITVEELIDLEQQAEFFVVLGQDDAAVELLESHVQNTAGASPLPYLKLLEIYQRLGRKTQYQQVQADFNSRFNAYAPSWEADLQLGHSLEDYPGVVERLQALWSPPAQAMDVLQKSLTRPDESVETFDLPAYRELLFLYAIARDLSERESDDRQPVDLMGDAAHKLITASDATGAPAGAPSMSHEPLMATRPVKAAAHVQPPSLSLDLSLDEPSSGHGALVDDAMLDIDLPDLDAFAEDFARSTRDGKTTRSGNDIEFEHIDLNAPHKKG